MTGIRDNGPISPNVVVFFVALFLFASPFTDWWAALRPPWFVAHLLWLGLTVIVWLMARRLWRHEL